MTYGGWGSCKVGLKRRGGNEFAWGNFPSFIHWGAPPHPWEGGSLLFSSYPALTNLGEDTPRSLLTLLLSNPSVSRLEPRGEGRPVLGQGWAGAAPGGRGAPGAEGRWEPRGAGGRGVAASLPRAQCSLTFSSLDTFNSWRN